MMDLRNPSCGYCFGYSTEILLYTNAETAAIVFSKVGTFDLRVITHSKYG